ncbi:MAG: competence/damage-inducible protein A, partial [Microvirga sp.]
MARIPEGADLIENPISKAPGFRIGNVIVMAGVPSIMQAMLDRVAPTLDTGDRMVIETLEAGSLGEGLYGAGLAAIAQEHPRVSIGSYPSFTATGFRNQIVVRGKEADAVAEASRAVAELVAGLTAGQASA